MRVVAIRALVAERQRPVRGLEPADRLLEIRVAREAVVGDGLAQRMREVGIRVSLGAERAQIVRLLMGGGLKLVLIGVILGMGASLLAAPILASLLFGIRPLDIVAFTAMPASVRANVSTSTVSPYGTSSVRKSISFSRISSPARNASLRSDS